MTAKTKDKLDKEIRDRYKLIHALHLCYYTQIDHAVAELAIEFYYVVGDILEGQRIREDKLKFIDMKRVRSFLQEEN